MLAFIESHCAERCYLMSIKARLLVTKMTRLWPLFTQDVFSHRRLGVKPGLSASAPLLVDEMLDFLDATVQLNTFPSGGGLMKLSLKSGELCL